LTSISRLRALFRRACATPDDRSQQDHQRLGAGEIRVLPELAHDAGGDGGHRPERVAREVRDGPTPAPQSLSTSGDCTRIRQAYCLRRVRPAGLARERAAPWRSLHLECCHAPQRRCRKQRRWPEQMWCVLRKTHMFPVTRYMPSTYGDLGAACAPRAVVS
jgi:hypothetical protein